MSSWGALGLPLAPAAAAAGTFAGVDDVVFFLCARVVVGRTRATTIMVGQCTSTRRATQTSTSEYVTARVCNYASALSCLVVINGPHIICMHMRAVLWRLWWLVRCHAVSCAAPLDRLVCGGGNQPTLDKICNYYEGRRPRPPGSAGGFHHVRWCVRWRHCSHVYMFMLE